MPCPGVMHVAVIGGQMGGGRGGWRWSGGEALLC
jgi:hypothetical protein